MKPTLSILSVITVILFAFIIAQHFQFERMKRVCVESQAATTQAQALAAESLRLGNLAVEQRDTLQTENATLRAENEKVKVWLERGEEAIHPNSYYDTNFLLLKGTHAQIITNSVP